MERGSCVPWEPSNMHRNRSYRAGCESSIRAGLSDTLPGCPGFLRRRPGLEEGRCRKRAAPEPSPDCDSASPASPPLSLSRCREDAPAKPCTPSTRRMCRTSVLAARPRARSPCECPCAAPTAPSSTTWSSTPCSARAPPGNAARDALPAADTRCLSPGSATPAPRACALCSRPFPGAQ